MRRSSAVLGTLAVVLSVPALALADDGNSDNGYDPGSPAGKQYVDPFAGVVGGTEVKHVSRPSTGASNDAGLFGAGVRVAAATPKPSAAIGPRPRHRPHRSQRSAGSPAAPPAASNADEQDADRAKSEARADASSDAGLLVFGGGGLVLLVVLAGVLMRRGGQRAARAG